MITTVISWVLPIIGLAAAMWAAYQTGSTKAKNKANEESFKKDEVLAAQTIVNERAANDKTNQTLQEVSDAKSKVNDMSVDAIADSLRDNWTRPDDSANSTAGDSPKTDSR